LLNKHSKGSEYLKRILHSTAPFREQSKKGGYNMKKTFLIFTAAFLFLVGVSANGFAYSFTDLYTESYWEPAGGYDYGTSDFGAGLGDYIGTGSLPNYGDATVINFFVNSGYTDVNQIGITGTSIAGLAGEWEAINPDPPVNFVNFLMVKGSTGFSVHEYDPAATYGIWNVGYLPDAGGSGMPAQMSFVRAFNTGGTPGTPVPEPATMLLLGSGLIGLAGYGRRKLFKK